MTEMTDAQKLEIEIMQKSLELAALRASEEGEEVKDYSLQTLHGETSLSGLFGGRERLLAIHNMGQGCRYCTLWADGINGLLDHLEDAMAVVLLSKDSPETQRQMALDRGWRFQMASHGGGEYMTEQCAMGEHANIPGAIIYERDGDKIIARGRTAFGPGDLYSPVWHFLSLAGVDASEWTPQFNYWRRPKTLDDGGENLRD